MLYRNQRARLGHRAVVGGGDRLVAIGCCLADGGFAGGSLVVDGGAPRGPIAIAIHLVEIDRGVGHEGQHRRLRESGGERG